MTRRAIERVMCAVAMLGVSACVETPRREDSPPPGDPGEDPVLGGDAGEEPEGDAGVAAGADAGTATEPDAGELWCELWGVCTGADADGDGYDDRVDCDDADPDVHPDREGGEGPWGAATCCDGIDNDCNGSVDGGEEGTADGCCTLWAPCMEEI